MPKSNVSGIVAVELAYEFASTGVPESGHLANPLFRVLSAIRTEGSIAAAARLLGQSYRHLWGYLKRQEDRLGRALIQWDKGRAARLTPFAEKLLWAEAGIRARLAPRIENLATEIGRELTVAFNDDVAIAEVVASHDLALPGLRALCQQAGLLLDLHFAGSLDALAALRQDRCAFAGIHLPLGRPELAARGSILHRSFGPWLRPGKEKLIRVARRTQGMIVASGNPLGIQALDDLARVRFVNRAQGAGTRVLLDQLLAERGIAPGRIDGYERLETTHLSVATCVASGDADAGFGIEAAARQQGLDFVPVVQEDYFFACSAETVDTPVALQLREALASPGWREVLAKLPGYSATEPGSVVSLRRALPWHSRPARSKKNRTSVGTEPSFVRRGGDNR
jgi:putative molybdopterin biosynthesis protein